MAPVESTPHPHATVPDPLANAKFSLNSLGVAGFFGGDIAVNGMATVIFFIGRRFVGLYNAPGSLEVAKRYGQLASSRVYRGLFPGGDTTDPAQLFGLDGKDGPKFLAAHSGSLFEKTSHLGHLIARMARREECEPWSQKRNPHRTTTPGTVTVIDLGHLEAHEPRAFINPAPPYHVHSAHSARSPLKHYGLLALFPIITSIGGCVGSALVADWWSFGCILLGMVANGCACFVLGSAKLAFQHPEPAQTAPRGDGILWAGNDIVVIRGSERAVNTITRGRFFLQYDKRQPDEDAPSRASASQERLKGVDDREESPVDNADLPVNDRESPVETGEPRKIKRDGDYDAPKGGKPDSFWIGIASLLLTLQFLVQLLLIPQATLFGQLMFVCTLAASGGYNAYLSSINREDIQTGILCDILKLSEHSPGGGQKIRKFQFATWTSTSTFACLALQPGPNHRLPDSSKVLNALIPNDTEVWNKWKGILTRKLRSKVPWEFTNEDRTLKRAEYGDTQGRETEEEKRQRQEDEKLLSLFISDAETTYQRYRNAFPE